MIYIKQVKILFLCLFKNKKRRKKTFQENSETLKLNKISISSTLIKISPTKLQCIVLVFVSFPKKLEQTFPWQIFLLNEIRYYKHRYLYFFISN